MLETAPDAHIGTVEKPLIGYHTAPASFNIRSMSRRLELIKYLIEKHNRLYTEHMAEAILGIESIGDGGMAAAVRIASLKESCSP